MKRLLAILWLASSTLGLMAAEKKPIAKKTEAEAAADATVDAQTLPRWVVILGVYKDFPEARTDARKFAKASGVPFTMNGMIFDKKGLRLPDDADDPIYAGSYLARRGNTGWEGKKTLEEHLSIERSDGYEGFAKGYYIVVGSITDSSKNGLAQVERFKPFAPQTYLKRTRIYLGCLH